MTAKSKSFRDSLNENMNPALQFITPAQAPRRAAAPQGETPPHGYKKNPLYVETKSRRLQLLLQPSLYQKLKEQAALAGQSVNEFVHAALEERLLD